MNECRNEWPQNKYHESLLADKYALAVPVRKMSFYQKEQMTKRFLVHSYNIEYLQQNWIHGKN